MNTERVEIYWKTAKNSRWVVAASATALVLHILQVEVLARLNGNPPLYWVLFIIGLFLASIILSATAVVMALATSLRNEQKGVLLGTILTSYACLVLTFASTYYSMTAWGDHNDAVEAHIYYHYEGLKKNRGYLKEVRPRFTTERAFRGMESKLWRGVEDISVPYHNPASGPPAVEDILQRSLSDSPEDTVRFNPKDRPKVFLDCLHFSIVTIATVGYGDISPNSWSTKVAADLEILAGTTLLVVGLGLLFSNWWPPKLGETKPQDTQVTTPSTFAPEPRAALSPAGNEARRQHRRRPRRRHRHRP